jgi:nicotinamide riboside kinase
MILGHVPDDMRLAPLADLYLLTDIDVPWTDDGTRYYPDEARRRAFMTACRDVLAKAGANWVEIDGNWEERFARAVAAIEALGPPGDD